MNTPSLDTVRRVLERLGVPANEVSLSDGDVHRGFSGAVVWRGRFSDGFAVAIRAWPSGDFPPERLLGLHRLLDHVACCGMGEVAVPIGPPGATLVTIDGRDWQVEPWLGGSPDLESDPTPERLRAAMGAIARWHDAASRFVPRGGESTWFAVGSGGSPAVLERLDRITSWTPERIATAESMLARQKGPFRELGGELLDGFQRHAASIFRELESFATRPFPLLPCLRDVHAGHVLFEGTRVSGLLDTSACRTDCAALDLARLIGDIDCEFGDEWGVGVGAYREFRAIGPEEVNLAGTLARSAVVLNGTTWLSRCCREDGLADRDPRIVERVSRLVDRLRRFDG